MAWALALVCLCGACSAQARLPGKIALLAPFEGEYRELGYNALYAARMALEDAAGDWQLLALDDGGGLESARARMQALQLDPVVAAVVAMGPRASHPDVQAVNDLPLVLIGNWGHDRADEQSLYAAHPDLARQAGDLHLLEQARQLGAGRAGASIRSSGRLPAPAFRQRYRASSPYAPEPNQLAMLVYDIVSALARPGLDVDSLQHAGLSGGISFRDGYWQGAPVNVFAWLDGQLLQQP